MTDHETIADLPGARFTSEPLSHDVMVSVRTLVAGDGRYQRFLRSCVARGFDLKRFRLYATDLCLMNEVLGGRSHVIPFTLRHHSSSQVSASFEVLKSQLISRYRRYFVGRVLRAPSTTISFGWRGLLEGWNGKLRSGVATARSA